MRSLARPMAAAEIVDRLEKADGVVGATEGGEQGEQVGASARPCAVWTGGPFLADTGFRHDETSVERAAGRPSRAFLVV